MSSMTRKDFLKSAATVAAGAAAMGAVASSALADEAEQAPAEETAPAPAAAGILTPGTYTDEQDTGYARVLVTCTFDASTVTDVAYEVLESSDNDYFVPFADAAAAYCDAIVAAGTSHGVDTMAGASLCSKAIADGFENCLYQALGVDKKVGPDFVNKNPQDLSIFHAAETDLSHVFSPLQVGPMTLKNRVCKCSGSATWPTDPDAVLQPAALDYYGTMAENGVSLLVIATGSGVLNGVFRLAEGQERAPIDEIVEGAKPLIDRIHAAGSYVGFQFTMGYPMGDGADECTLEEIQQTVKDVSEQAAISKQLGADFVELKGSSGDTLNAFYSRRANHREDEYGPQSFENRTRVWSELIAGVKESCGEDFPIIALINAMEIQNTPAGVDGGHITIEEGQQLAKFLEDSGVCLIQVRVGAPGVNEAKSGLNECNSWAPDIQHSVYKVDGMNGDGQLFDYSQHAEGLMDGSHNGLGGFLPIARAIKQAVSIPVGCVGDMDLRAAPDFIDQAIADGSCDVIFMNRPLMADPELVQKMQEGRRDEVTPCCHCLHCHDAIRDARGGLDWWPNYPEKYCRVSAPFTRAYTDEMPEGRTPAPAETPKNVMVIGGGPAGMECARVAAQRGHTVTLYESKATLGGLLPFAEGVKGRHESLGDLRTYLIKGLELAGVTVNTSTTVDAAMVQEAAPDVVVVATGGARESKLEATDDVVVLSLEQAFGTPAAQNIAIVGVGVQAFDMANFLMAQGKKVTMVNVGGIGDIDKEQSTWTQKFGTRQFYSEGGVIYSEATVNGIVDGGLSITYQGAERVIPCEAVVEGYDMVPNTALADEIAAAGFEVHTVGDCAEPFNIGKAINNANLLARSL